MLLSLEWMVDCLTTFSELQNHLGQPQLQLQVITEAPRRNCLARFTPLQRDTCATIGRQAIAFLDPGEPLYETVNLMARFLKPFRIGYGYGGPVFRSHL